MSRVVLRPSFMDPRRERRKKTTAAKVVPAVWLDLQEEHLIEIGSGERILVR